MGTQQVFVKKIVTEGLAEFFKAEEDFGTNPTQVVLVPSLLDAHHEFVFPQVPVRLYFAVLYAIH